MPRGPTILRERGGYLAGMEPISVGLVADPASPTEMARPMRDLEPSGSEDRGWDIEVVSEPFTVECEDVDTALTRLGDHAREHEWDLVVGLTELPLRDDDGRYLLVETDPQRQLICHNVSLIGDIRLVCCAGHH